MTRKIGALGLVLMMLVSNFAFSAEAQDTGLYVNYKIPTDSIDIILTAPNAESANVVITNEKGPFDVTTEFALLRELEKGADGKFRYNAAMPYSSESGKYYVTVVTDTNDVPFQDSFWYMSDSSEAMAALTALENGTTIDELSSDQLGDLGIDVAEFNSAKEEITKAFESFFETGGEPDKKEFLTAYAYAYLFGKSFEETNLVAVEALFKKQADSLGFDMTAFNELNQESESWLLNKLTEGEYENAEPSALINEWLCLAEINNTAQDTVENFKNLLFTKYADTVVLNPADMSNYNGSSKKSDIILKFIQERPFDNMNELTEGFKKAVNTYKGGDNLGGPGAPDRDEKGDKTSQTQFEYLPGGDSASIFTDVPVSHWAYSRIKALYEKGIVAGNGEGKFFPENSVTRAEFAKIISMAFFKSQTASDISYSDVNKEAWYYEYVAKLSGLGIILGDDRGYFNPDAPITRQDAAVIIRRVTQKRGKELPIIRSYSGFNDESNISGYAKDAIVVLYEAGLINGMTAGEFAPLNKLTRAQAVQLVAVTME